jgi:dynein heavy chain
MTALFVKVTNQMINACRAHITDNGYHKVWEQEREDVIVKMEQCIRLNKEYQLCFQRTKKRLEEHPDEKPFDFSEMYIFGKFDSFCKRVANIIEFLRTTKTYETLSLSRIEGIETFNSRFNLLVTGVKKRPYDILDHRKDDFEVDYEDFKQQLKDLDLQIQAHMDSFYENLTSVPRAILFTQRFQRLLLPCLDTQTKWRFAVSLYMKDLNFVKNEYNTHKHLPPLNRDLPPLVGRIAWSRQLYHRISEPIDSFQRQEDVLNMPETRKAIKSFNKLARVSYFDTFHYIFCDCYENDKIKIIMCCFPLKVLVEYEILHINMWEKKISSVEKSLNSTLLVKDQDTEIYYVNFDPQINELMREIDVMDQMKVEVPLKARQIRTLKEAIKLKYNNLKVILNGSISNVSC